MSVRTECHGRIENAILFLSFCIFWPFPRQRYNLSLSPFLPPPTKWLGQAEITQNDKSPQVNHDLNNEHFSGLNRKKANGIGYWLVWFPNPSQMGTLSRRSWKQDIMLLVLLLVLYTSQTSYTSFISYFRSCRHKSLCNQVLLGGYFGCIIPLSSC